MYMGVVGLIHIIVSWPSKWGTIKDVQIDHNIICMVYMYMHFDVMALVVYQSGQDWITYC